MAGAAGSYIIDTVGPNEATNQHGFAEFDHAGAMNDVESLNDIAAGCVPERRFLLVLSE